MSRLFIAWMAFVAVVAVVAIILAASFATRLNAQVQRLDNLQQQVARNRVDTAESFCRRDEELKRSIRVALEHFHLRIDGARFFQTDCRAYALHLVNPR